MIASIYISSSGVSIIPPTQRPPLCQANHGKPLAASGFAAFGSVTSGLVASTSKASRMVAFSLAVPVDGFGLAVVGSVSLLQLVMWHQILPWRVWWQQVLRHWVWQQSINSNN